MKVRQGRKLTSVLDSHRNVALLQAFRLFHGAAGTSPILALRPEAFRWRSHTAGMIPLPALDARDRHQRIAGRNRADTAELPLLRLSQDKLRLPRPRLRLLDGIFSVHHPLEQPLFEDHPLLRDCIPRVERDWQVEQLSVPVSQELKISADHGGAERVDDAHEALRVLNGDVSDLGQDVDLGRQYAEALPIGRGEVRDAVEGRPVVGRSLAAHGAREWLVQVLRRNAYAFGVIVTEADAALHHSRPRRCSAETDDVWCRQVVLGVKMLLKDSQKVGYSLGDLLRLDVQSRGELLAPLIVEVKFCLKFGELGYVDPAEWTLDCAYRLDQSSRCRAGPLTAELR